MEEIITTETEKLLPSDFIDRLKQIIPAGLYEKVIRSFGTEKFITFRVNTGQSREVILARITQSGLSIEEVPWFVNAFIIKNGDNLNELRNLEEEGAVYRQGLSSLLVPVVLNPRPGEIILDACAAPGSKTTQISQMMNNTGEILAIEGVRQRMFKLKSVIQLQGAGNIKTVLMDARKYRAQGLAFDKILVDAPCSSEGRFDPSDKKSFAYWSLRKIREMRKKQKGILLNAARWLKPGGLLVYSTCTFAPEENEQVVDWFLRKEKGRFFAERISTAEFTRVDTYPAVERWGELTFSPEVSNCLRILPDDFMNGFFIAKLRRAA
ncbi:MAG: RsmB/NOP family class I SAM-dependent RNA methyltransferase [Candidatus Omnitrophota bacterium]